MMKYTPYLTWVVNSRNIEETISGTIALLNKSPPIMIGHFRLFASSAS
jgi:hypothetical protein